MDVSRQTLRWGLPFITLLLCHCSVLLRESVESERESPDGSPGSTASGDGGTSVDAVDSSSTDGAADSDTDRPFPAPCGNGILEGGEECDASSPFCDGCQLVPLPGGFSCWSLDNGSRFFFHVPDMATDPTWNQSRSECERGLEGHLDGLPFSYYGLAVLWDSAVYRCVYQHFDGLEGRENFHIGLRKNDRDAWEWVFRNSAREKDSEPFGPIHEFDPDPYLDHGDGACASFHSDPAVSSWDYWHLDEDPCDDAGHDPARPLCMVAF